MRERFNLAFPSLLLIGVAAVQIVRAHTHGQSPWKGGGFGMFASSDSPEARFVRCILVGPEKEFRVMLPSRLSGGVTLARTVPTGENLEELAQDALDLTWVREDYSPIQPVDPAPAPAGGDDGGSALPGENPVAPAASRVDTSFLTYRALGRTEPRPPVELVLEVKSIRIEVWRTRLDASGSRMEAVQIRSVTVDR